ncbi:MAG TPA: zinc-ribbon domain-containing protein, partial [Candidatus Accumulibacter phosphatis]|nr:zinc-ribbon domain-containing protein [Candidatus Accumulibacter phosphatis]
MFRVTSEQLRLRAGKVRCGQCRAVFNAIDNLADDAGDALPVTAPAAAAALPEPPGHRRSRSDRKR